MNDEEDRDCCHRKRGRPRVCRTIGEDVDFQCYRPVCDKNGVDEGSVTIDPAEMESMRLVDLLGMDQESAANTIGVSRKTLWRDLHEARRKVTEALVNGKTIHISGCKRQEGHECPQRADQ